MTLRKKFSRKFSKANIKADPPPPPVPTPDLAKVLTLPPVRPSSPLLESSSSLVRPGVRKHLHRRSRSFSALTPPTAAFASCTPLRESVYSQYSNNSTYSIDQPWRSQETWRALHAPPRYPSSPLTLPSALPTGSGGWRSKVGEGFSSGRNTPRPRRKTLNGEDERSVSSSASEGWDDGRGELLYELQELQLDRAAAYSTLPRSNTGIRSSPLKTTLLPSPSVPELSHSSTTSEESHSAETPTHPHGGHQRNESLLPPLLPINVQKTPHRSSSFTSLHSSRPALTPRDSFGVPPAPSAVPAAIPWGRRSSADRRSASPTPAKPPVPPRSALRLAQRTLPLPPPPVQMPVSPEDDDLFLPETEDDFDQDASFSPMRERLTTPVTPPAGIGRRDTNKSYASGWSSTAGSRNGMSSRQPSWATFESRDKHRGGWI